MTTETAHAARTADLATKLKDRAARRASRSVDSELLEAAVGAVLPMPATTRRSESTVSPSPDAADGESVAQPARRRRESASTSGGETRPKGAVAGGTTASAFPVAQPGSSTSRAGDDPSPDAAPAGLETDGAEGAVARPTPGRRGRLELSGERVVKMTLELPIPVVDALAMWERDETRSSGQRVYRERLIDCALAELPSDVDAIIALARALRADLVDAETEQVGTRVRETIHRRLQDLRPELRLRRVKDVYLRQVYAAAITSYLERIGATAPRQT